ncbi:MAG: response regulator [Phycisphaerales bacterium]|nr:response regulator [Phycisphaerales bacterium]
MNERRTRILFVDDESNVLSSIRRLLRSESSIWEIFTADSVDRGIECIQADEIDLVVSDFNMPEKDGLELLGWITKNYSLNTVPFIMLTGNAEHDLKRRAINAGAVDLLNKPIMKEDLLARLRNAINVRDYQKSLVDLNAELESRVEERTKELESSRNELLWRLAYATEARDDVTGTHIDSVARLTKQIALSYGLIREQVDCIHLASMLHDIGKIAIPDSILLKPGKLTDDERKHMETHCKSGWYILTRPTNIDGSSSGPNQLLECAAEVALSHHEYWDGHWISIRSQGR